MCYYFFSQSRTSIKTNKSALSKSGDDISSENRSTIGSPIQEFLHLELYNALQLIQHVHLSLASIARACKGTQLVTGVMHQLANSLLHGETPDSWLLQWPEGPNEVVPFLRELVVKANAVQVSYLYIVG